jgi:hypothetical protein
LQDFNNIDVLESNNAIILQRPRDVKRMLKEYQGILKDHHKANVLEPNNVSFCEALEISKRCWRIVKKPTLSSKFSPIFFNVYFSSKFLSLDLSHV